MQRWRDEQGFTVVELLVALAILGLVVATLASVFDVTRRMLLTVNSASEEVEEVRLIRRLLIESLGQVTPPRIHDSSVVGDNRSMSVLASGPRVLASDAPVLLRLDPDPDSRGLLASWRKEPNDGSVSWPTRRIVAPERQVRFSYFSQGAGWIESWSNEKQPPALVRVSLVETDSDRRAELIFATRGLAQAACDPRSSGARCMALP